MNRAYDVGVKIKTDNGESFIPSFIVENIFFSPDYQRILINLNGEDSKSAIDATKDEYDQIVGRYMEWLGRTECTRQK
jgi:hypothetical protein